MVAVTILALILIFVGQIATGTSASISRTTRDIAITTMANNAFDRISSTMAGMITTGSGTMVAIKGTGAGSDSLVFLSNSRISSRTGVTQPIRMSGLGFGVVSMTDDDVTGTPAIPMLTWGNGALIFANPSTFTASTSASNGQIQPSTALQYAVNDMALAKTNGSGNTFLDFQPLGTGIFRLEVCFLSSNGNLLCGTQAAVPLNKNFTSTYTGKQLPLAFKPVDSNDTTNSTYVRAIVVGIAVIDPPTQNLLTTRQLTTTLPNDFPKVTTDGVTPLQKWDFSNQTPTTVYSSLKNFGKPAVLQYTRIYQRYIYVN